MNIIKKLDNIPYFYTSLLDSFMQTENILDEFIRTKLSTMTALITVSHSIKIKQQKISTPSNANS